MISIVVAYATLDKQVEIPLCVKEGCTIEEAIRLSGIEKQFPDIDLSIMPVGIFSVCEKLQTVVKEGDRVEIYRALIKDPKELRREKVKKNKKK